jgi:hypothetical protein
MIGHPGRAEGAIAATDRHRADRMADRYKIIVRGVMSDRFCRGFAGLSGRAGAGLTVLEAGPQAGPRLAEVLRRLENLGLEVIAVEPAGGHGHDTQED